MGSDKSSAGSAAGSSSQPPVSAAAATSAVCCMCGDRGLLPELFRCAACAVRSQHTYCTERYPKAGSYGTCNWCLRSDGGYATTSSSARLSTPRSAAADPARSAAAAAAKVVAARGHFVADLSKPIKKPAPAPQQRRILLRRSASDLGGRVRGGVGGEHNAPPPPSPGVARGRPRVRRYKLLEEVITTS